MFYRFALQAGGFACGDKRYEDYPERQERLDYTEALYHICHKEILITGLITFELSRNKFQFKYCNRGQTALLVVIGSKSE